MHASVEKLLGKVIVSCQAYEDTPLYGAQYMQAMASCALLGGASGIRACWKQDVAAIRELGDFPIIGINKVKSDNDEYSGIFITPTFETAKEVIDAGADILALDCTLREFRGKEALYEVLKQIKDNFPHIAIMADCASIEDAKYASETGLVDIIATTLSRNAHQIGHPDIDFIKEIKKISSIPINAEGSIWELADFEEVVKAGADMITIGTAITRPHLITKRFVEYNEKLQSE